MGEIHELFVLALSLVWFAGATPDFRFLTHFFVFSAFLRFSSLFVFFPYKGQGQTTAIYCKNGEFHSDSVCTDPVQNFPNFYYRRSIFSTEGSFGKGAFARGALRKFVAS